MADIADIAQELIDAEAEARARRAPYILPAGTPGECDTCGAFSMRLVGGDCAGCREIGEARVARAETMRLQGDRELPTPLLPEDDGPEVESED